MPRRNVSILLTAMAVTLLCLGRSDRDPRTRYLADAYHKIDDFAYDQVPDRELFEGAVEGMVTVLRRRGDPHTGFVSRRDKPAFDEEFTQEFGGIGVHLRVEGEPPRLVIAGPLHPQGPAREAGLLPGDTIRQIDDWPVPAMDPNTFDEVIVRLRGKPDSQVRLTVDRPGESSPRTVSLKRALLTTESVIGDRCNELGTWQHALPEYPGIALVRVLEFGNRTVQELDAVLGRLAKEGTRGVVLDLRENPGGPLDAGIGLCELLLPAGKPVVETRDRQGRVLGTTATQTGGKFLDVPLVVLVNRNSASASELVAGCLGDAGRAAIAGERSYGKGTVQQLLPIEGGQSYLKLTSATFWRPSGKPIHRDRHTPADGQWGIDPDQGLAVATTEAEHQRWLENRGELDRTVLGTGDAPPRYDPLLARAAQHLLSTLAPEPPAEE